MIKQHLRDFNHKLMKSFFERLCNRYAVEKITFGENNLFIRSLDRLYRRISNFEKLYSLNSYLPDTLSIIENACDLLFIQLFELIKEKYSEKLVSSRHAILGNSEESQVNLSEILLALESHLSEQIKIAIHSLTGFMNPKLSFYSKSFFKEKLGFKIREEIVVAAIKYIVHSSLEYSKKPASSSPKLILLLSRLCVDFDLSLVSSIINAVETELNIDKNGRYLLTSTYELHQESKNASQQLLNHYVKIQGQQISSMIKKSIEARDWLTAVEPKTVRSVMKRIVNDIAAIDAEVGQLLEEGSRTDRSSDSSRNRRVLGTSNIPGKLYTKNQSWNYHQSGVIDNSLISNIQKLFSERIEIFSAVEFNKLSVVTGIVKISLKTFLECVRLCTFSKCGMQQIQIDAYYLQMQLWRFVTDENLTCNLLDDVLISSFQRCLEPVRMDNSKVEKICEDA